MAGSTNGRKENTKREWHGIVEEKKLFACTRKNINIFSHFTFAFFIIIFRPISENSIMKMRTLHKIAERKKKINDGTAFSPLLIRDSRVIFAFELSHSHNFPYLRWACVIYEFPWSTTNSLLLLSSVVVVTRWMNVLCVNAPHSNISPCVMDVKKHVFFIHLFIFALKGVAGCCFAYSFFFSVSQWSDEEINIKSNLQNLTTRKIYDGIFFPSLSLVPYTVCVMFVCIFNLVFVFDFPSPNNVLQIVSFVMSDTFGARPPISNSNHTVCIFIVWFRLRSAPISCHVLVCRIW